VLGEIEFILNLSLLQDKLGKRLFLKLALLFGDGIPCQKCSNPLYLQHGSWRLLGSDSSQNLKELSLEKSKPSLAKRSHSL
jgi:hypothetical protein